MTLTDPIADMLTRIRNAMMVRKKDVQIPYSRMNGEIAKILKEEGYIRGYRVIEGKVQGTLNVTLKYKDDRTCTINGLQRTSKPGCRIYCNADSIPKVLNGLGIVIVSTSHGLLTGKKCEENRLGGEVICKVW